MRIEAIETRFEGLAVTRPYTIAFRTIDAVELGFVEIRAEGAVGRGSASPERYVTGESIEMTRAALAPEQLGWLVGQDVRALPRLLRELAARIPRAPAARAALDMALHDLFAQRLGLPLVEVLGRAHESLPTSITIGIKPTGETLEEAAEYLERGFRALKVKLGHSVAEDIERVLAVRREAGEEVAIRVDANQGYGAKELERFAAATAAAGVELIEQPLAAADTAGLRSLAPELRARIAADESLLQPLDALALAAPEPACGIFNIKLMKAGGLGPGLDIARIAGHAGIELMWGCMDESRIGIAAALHAALSSPATRYLDLDGHLDLAADVVSGGFVLEDGWMRTLDRPGLGLEAL